jgi:hypothetical protein
MPQKVVVKGINGVASAVEGLLVPEALIALTLKL